MFLNGKKYDVDWLRRKVATGLPIDPMPLADFLKLVDELWEERKDLRAELKKLKEVVPSEQA